MGEIHDKFQEGRRYLLERTIRPAMVVFSHEGLWKARKEEYQHFRMANGMDVSTYCGLPYGVDPKQPELIKVTGPAPEYAVSPLSDAQLCDIIDYQLQIRMRDGGTISPLLQSMKRSVIKYGRFE